MQEWGRAEGLYPIFLVVVGSGLRLQTVGFGKAQVG